MIKAKDDLTVEKKKEKKEIQGRYIYINISYCLFRKIDQQSKI